GLEPRPGARLRQRPGAARHLAVGGPVERAVREARDHRHRGEHPLGPHQEVIERQRKLHHRSTQHPQVSGDEASLGAPPERTLSLLLPPRQNELQLRARLRPRWRRCWASGWPSRPRWWCARWWWWGWPGPPPRRGTGWARGGSGGGAPGRG